uniref:DNA replication factor Cdt1 n=1 Tax=Myxine glutinosa TaxID=7769 RepID=UPI00358FCD58
MAQRSITTYFSGCKRNDRILASKRRKLQEDEVKTIRCDDVNSTVKTVRCVDEVNSAVKTVKFVDEVNYAVKTVRCVDEVNSAVKTVRCVDEVNSAVKTVKFVDEVNSTMKTVRCVDEVNSAVKTVKFVDEVNYAVKTVRCVDEVNSAMKTVRFVDEVNSTLKTVRCVDEVKAKKELRDACRYGISGVPTRSQIRRRNEEGQSEINGDGLRVCERNEEGKGTKEGEKMRKEKNDVRGKAHKGLEKSRVKADEVGKQNIFIKGKELESNVDGHGEDKIKRRGNKNDREKEDGMEKEPGVVKRSVEVQKPVEAKEKRIEMNVNKDVKRMLLQVNDKKNERKVMVKTMSKKREERELGKMVDVIPCIENDGTNLKVEKTVEELSIGKKKEVVKKKVVAKESGTEWCHEMVEEVHGETSARGQVVEVFVNGGEGGVEEKPDCIVFSAEVSLAKERKPRRGVKRRCGRHVPGKRTRVRVVDRRLGHEAESETTSLQDSHGTTPTKRKISSSLFSVRVHDVVEAKTVSPSKMICTLSERGSTLLVNQGGSKEDLGLQDGVQDVQKGSGRSEGVASPSGLAYGDRSLQKPPRLLRNSALLHLETAISGSMKTSEGHLYDRSPKENNKDVVEIPKTIMHSKKALRIDGHPLTSQPMKVRQGGSVGSDGATSIGKLPTTTTQSSPPSSTVVLAPNLPTISTKVSADVTVSSSQSSTTPTIPVTRRTTTKLEHQPPSDPSPVVMKDCGNPRPSCAADGSSEALLKARLVKAQASRLLAGRQSGSRQQGGQEQPIARPSEPAFRRFHHLIQDTPPGLVLPVKYKLLTEMFHCLDTAVAMMYNRAERATFSKVQQAVQAMLRRRFDEKQLGQIRWLLPDAFCFRQELVPAVRGSGGPSCSYQLTFEPKILSEDGEDSRPNLSPSHLIERRRALHSHLLSITKSHHKTFLTTLTPPMEEPPGLSRWHPQFQLDALPDIPAADLPSAPNINRPTSAHEAMALARGTFPPKMEQALLTVAEQNSAEVGGNGRTATAVPRHQTMPLVTPPALRGVSEDLLARIRAREARRIELEMTRGPVDTARQAMLARLPEMARILRTIFVAEHRPVLPFAVACKRLTESYGGGLGQDDLDRHIRLLAEVQPTWLTLLPLRSELYLRLDRAADLSVVTLALQERLRREQQVK